MPPPFIHITITPKPIIDLTLLMQHYFAKNEDMIQSMHLAQELRRALLYANSN